MSSLISCVSWVKRGVAANHPSKYVLDDNELQRVSALARIELEDARRQLQKATETAHTLGKDVLADDAGDDEDEWVDEDDSMEVDEPPAANGTSDGIEQYNLDTYDEEENAIESGPFSTIKGLTYYRDNEDDPYITLPEDEEATEREELEVLPTDNLLVAAKTEDDISQLDVYIWDDAEENLYVHHDLMLPNFPLCLEWLDFPLSSPSSAAAAPGKPAQFGNYIAVGTLDPEIEIWSLDVVDALYPDALLGRPDATAAHVPTPAGTGKKKKKKAKHRAPSAAHHVDAVLALSWNRAARNMLASGSADRTVKLWDLSRAAPGKGKDAAAIGGEGGGEAIRSFDVHKDKVQALQWNPAEPTVLLSGSYDRTVRVFDSRAPGQGVGAALGSDVEALRWDPWDTNAFFVSLENGLVLNFDVRQLPSDIRGSTAPVRWTLSAHDGPASALDVNPHMRGCLVTGGGDKMVKVWNIAGTEDAQAVSLVTSRDLGVGKVFSAVWSPDDPLTLAAAGSKAKLQLWDVGANAGARSAFNSRIAEAGRILREARTGGGVIGVASDDEESEAEE